MEDKVSIVEVLIEKTGLYAQRRIELYKLKAIDKSADVISTLAVRLVILSLIILFFLVLNIGLALWIGEVLGKNYFGFFSVAAFYALIGIVFFIFRHKWIKAPIRNSIIDHVLN